MDLVILEVFSNINNFIILCRYDICNSHVFLCPSPKAVLFECSLERKEDYLLSLICVWPKTHSRAVPPAAGILCRDPALEQRQECPAPTHRAGRFSGVPSPTPYGWQVFWVIYIQLCMPVGMCKDHSSSSLNCSLHVEGVSWFLFKCHWFKEE